MLPRACPICGSGSVEQILRETLISAHIDGFACDSAGAMSYHCDSGHVFLIVTEDFTWKEARPEGPGHSILV